MCDQLVVMYAGRVVESGPVSQILNSPAHPYTAALLNSIPRMTDNAQRLTAIEGQPPDLGCTPPGALSPQAARAPSTGAARRLLPPEFRFAWKCLLSPTASKTKVGAGA
jgi:oligopeptide/dipeptide ABC transporter ATP-binding protein